MDSPGGLRRKETLSARGPPLRILSLGKLFPAGKEQPADLLCF